MSNMLNKQQMAEILLELLERTAFHREQMENYVNRLFEPFKSDGVPYVETGKDTYIVRIYERGLVWLEKRIKQSDEVIYWLLEDIIFTATHVELMERHGVDNKQTHLNYSNEVMKDLNRGVQEAFQKIGDPYLYWHMTSKRQELEQIQSTKER
ncbi:Imm63 family immunity protein [Paenibacillus xylanexedens]|uniref:Imm63 family immunity protein n=1 Tax=Paenibacillus xylanexedens TaxID=528191 RepID=UPI0011A3DDF8|nr:Imm63 family immunity protein [Paenibacillus xylanexedens]